MLPQLCHRYLKENHPTHQLTIQETKILEDLIAVCDHPIEEVLWNDKLDYGDSEYEQNLLMCSLDGDEVLVDMICYILSFQKMTDEVQMYEFIKKLPKEIRQMMRVRNSGSGNYYYRDIEATFNKFLKDNPIPK